MRITSFTIYNQLQQSLAKAMSDYSVTNNRLATGKKILAPSDDVNGMMRAMSYRVSINDSDQYKRNVDGATTNLSLTDTTLTSISDIIAKVKALTTTSMSGTNDASLRSSLSQQAAQWRDSLVGLANTRITDRFLFSGFRSDQQPYDPVTFDYQGDNGAMSVPIDHGATIQINVTGNDTFSYTPVAAYVKQISGGLNVHYTPGAGTTTNVEIRDAADTTVLDTFNFSNVMQMTDILGTAIGTNDTARMEALVDPLSRVQEQVAVVQSDVGARMSRLQDQSSRLTLNTNAQKNFLSATEDADMNETIMQLQMTDTTLQALRAASSKIISQSLFDFLK